MAILVLESDYLSLIDLINETYTDQVEQIIRAHINDAGDIVAIALDENRIIGFKYTSDDKVALKLLNPKILDDDLSELEDLELLPDLELPTSDELNTDDATPAKRIIQWQGFDIGLQYFPFDKRHGKVLQAAYGHFRKTRGADGMAVDVYVGSNLKSPKVFAIDQLINGEFDEQKMVIGCDRLEEAIDIYLSAMPQEMMGNAKEISLDELRSYKVNFETKVDTIQKKIDTEPFKPDPVTLSQVSVYDNLLDLTEEGELSNETPSLEEVSTMLDPLDIRLDKGKGRSSAKKGSKSGGKARKNCEKGITCGGSCISRSKVCRKNGNETQKVLAKKIKTLASASSSVAEEAQEEKSGASLPQDITKNTEEESNSDDFFTKDAISKLASTPGQERPPENASLKGENFNPHADKNLTPQAFLETLEAKRRVSVQDDPSQVWNKTFADSGLSRNQYKNEMLNAMRSGVLPSDSAFVNANFNRTQRNEYESLRKQIDQVRQTASRHDRAINHPLVSDRVVALHSPQMNRAQAEAFSSGSFLGGLTMYHGNSDRVASSIYNNGSQPERNARGIYGQGSYFGALKSTGELYAGASTTSISGQSAGMVAVKTNVRNPYVTDRNQIDKISQFFVGNQANNVDSVALTQYMRARGFDSIYLKDQGYLISFDGRQTTSFQYTNFSSGSRALAELQRRESSYGLKDRSLDNEAAAVQRLMSGTNFASLRNTENRNFGDPSDDFGL